jgi:uncharacterized protein YdeI (YjbR/CyaY-like superfamily)
MESRDPRVDAYIAKAAPFARPILERLREIVHAGCPGVEETMKWSVPHFTYRGLLCSMAAFKQHCAFGFWKGAHVLGPGGRSLEQAWGQFGRITSPADLPSKKLLVGYVRKAAALNEAGVKRVAGKAPPRPKAPPRAPADLVAALRGNRKAAATYAAFSPSNKRDYVEWITEAKGAATRRRRLETAVQWMAEGKPRNWKYSRKRA